MTKKDTALKIMKAWKEKDERTLRALLHPHYVSKDPMMTVEGIDKTIEKMKEFPFEGDLEIDHLLAESDQVVVEGIWRLQKPVKTEIPIISLMKFEGDKLKEKRIFFDTAKLAK